MSQFMADAFAAIDQCSGLTREETISIRCRVAIDVRVAQAISLTPPEIRESYIQWLSQSTQAAQPQPALPIPAPTLGLTGQREMREARAHMHGASIDDGARADPIESPAGEAVAGARGGIGEGRRCGGSLVDQKRQTAPAEADERRAQNQSAPGGGGQADGLSGLGSQARRGGRGHCAALARAAETGAAHRHLSQRAPGAGGARDRCRCRRCRCRCRLRLRLRVGRGLRRGHPGSSGRIRRRCGRLSMSGPGPRAVPHALVCVCPLLPQIRRRAAPPRSPPTRCPLEWRPPRPRLSTCRKR